MPRTRRTKRASGSKKVKVQPTKKIESISLYEIVKEIDPRECENRVVVSPIDRWKAYSFLCIWKDFEGSYRRVYNIGYSIEDEETYTLLTPEEKEQLLYVYNSMYPQYKDYDKFQRDVIEFIKACAKRYVWFRYFCTLPYVGVRNALAILFYPPSLLHTIKHRKLEQNQWWNRLIPIHKYEEQNGRKVLVHTNKTLTAKSFYTDFINKLLIDPSKASVKFLLKRASVYNNANRIRQYILEQVRRETISVVGKEVPFERLDYDTKTRVLLRVCRNLLRVSLYNTYLVAWDFMWKYNIDTDKLVRPVDKPALPYEALNKPLVLLSYIEPIEIVHRNVVELAKDLIPNLEHIRHVLIVKEVLKIDF